MDDLLVKLVESIRTANTINAAAIVAFAVTEILLFVIANFLMLKALLLRRNTPLGVALAKNNTAMSLVYYSVFFGLWIPLARHPYLQAFLRIGVFITTYGAIRAFVDVYGGWRNVGAEIVASIRELGVAVVDELTGRTAVPRVLAATRRRHKPRLNEARLLAYYDRLSKEGL